MKTFNFNSKVKNNDNSLYFIADIGANHDGSLERAYKLIDLAKEAGADAAKFQNFQAHKIVSKFGFENLGQKISHQSAWKKSVYEIYEDASINFEWTSLLKEKCNEVGIEYFTSPYDFESVDFVDPFVSLYKIGSGDITWIEIIEYIAKKQKPVLIATGASNMDDVDRAMNAVLKYNDNIVLMQCNTNYTGDLDNFNYINLNVLNTFKAKYPNVTLGLSDHTSGDITVLGSISLGARVIEKHFTDDNYRSGPDHKFAMNPETWRLMVDRSNLLLKSMGDGVKRIEENERKSIIVQRRSIRAKSDLNVGHILTKDDFEFLRPIAEDGIPPFLFEEIIGKKIIKNIVKGEHFNKLNIQL